MERELAEVYDLDTYQPRTGVGHLLSRVRTEMLSALDKALEADADLSAMEISAAQFIVIAALALSDTAKSSSDLCRGISYDAGAMTRMIDRLETKGLIRRNRRPDDRRVVYGRTHGARRRAPTPVCVRYRWAWRTGFYAGSTRPRHGSWKAI